MSTFQQEFDIAGAIRSLCQRIESYNQLWEQAGDDDDDLTLWVDPRDCGPGWTTRNGEIAYDNPSGLAIDLSWADLGLKAGDYESLRSLPNSFIDQVWEEQLQSPTLAPC